MTNHPTTTFKLINAVILLILTISLGPMVRGEQCKSTGNVYGENEIIDQLMVCSLTKSFDLDLAPQGDYVKNTPKALIDQGFANKTSILYAKLSGLWSARRAGLVETSWRCEGNKTTVSTIIEVDGLALDVIEKVDIFLHRNQNKLTVHKPCKTFDIPVWLCRQTKPIYKTTKTWVNRAYFNLTLSQAAGSMGPKIEKLNLIFTCPETFRQKITHSPSAMYIIAKYMQNLEASFSAAATSQEHTETNKKLHKRSSGSLADGSIGHPVSYASLQDGKSPATPPYHNSVNLITNQATSMLLTSLNDCIKTLDLDLSLATDHNSFGNNRFNRMDLLKSTAEDKTETPGGGGGESLLNECSDQRWIMNRIDLAADVASWLESDKTEVAQMHSKRSQYMNHYPQDPSQLLNPYGYYFKNANQMIERR